MGLDSGLCLSNQDLHHQKVVVVTIVIIQRKLGELGSEGSRKGVSSRKCVMQKEGLEAEERISVLPLTAGKRDEQGAWGSLLSWSMCFICTVCSAGNEGQQHHGCSHRRAEVLQP